MLTLIHDLVAALDAAALSWCHWKSNINLVRAVKGEDDLDLLIAKDDRHQFEQILNRMGFCQFSSARESRTPGIYNYYGYDEDSGQLVHVHAHYALVLGHDLIKNYDLGAERAYLDGTLRSHGVRVPAVPKEYVVFVLRMVLKRRLLGWALTGPRTWARDILGGGPFGLAGNDSVELAELKQAANEAEIHAALAEIAPKVRPETWEQCVASLGPGASRWGRFWAGSRLAKELRSCAILPPWQAVVKAVGRRLAGLAGRLTKRADSRKKPRGGGRIIAVVGGDGAGKTTNIDNLHRWLGRKFVVRYLHFGKPPRDGLRLVWGLFLRLLRPFLGSDSTAHPAWIQSVGFVLLARDRRRALAKADRQRRAGEIIVVDRIHVPGLPLMDAPQIHRTFPRTPLLARLGEWERQYYAQMPEPDLIIVLRLDPEVAVVRKPEDGEHYVRTRNQALWNLAWPERNSFVVDSALPLEEVKTLVQARVWRCFAKRQRILELLGAPGTGKTTIVRGIRKQVPGLRTAVSTREFPGALIRHGLKSGGRFFRYLVQGVRPGVVGAMFLQEVQLGLLKTIERQEKLKYGFFLLDEGPLAGLVWVAGEAGTYPSGGLIDSWLKTMATGWATVLDGVLEVDAPDSVLLERINARNDNHRIKGGRPQEAAAFLHRVRESTTGILEQISGMVQVSRIDTQLNGIEEAVAKAASCLGLGDSS